MSKKSDDPIEFQNSLEKLTRKNGFNFMLCERNGSTRDMYRDNTYKIRVELSFKWKNE